MTEQTLNITPALPEQTYHISPSDPTPSQAISSQMPLMPDLQDTVMTEPSVATIVQPSAAMVSQPQQARMATPTRQSNGTSPNTVADVAPPMPSKAAAHGAPARRYLNEKVTGVLLEGMKRLAAEQPEDPLKVLGEYLLSRSRELESQSGV